MARDLTEETYYTMQPGSKIPVKWTAPEVSYNCAVRRLGKSLLL